MGRMAYPPVSRSVWANTTNLTKGANSITCDYGQLSATAPQAVTSPLGLIDLAIPLYGSNVAASTVTGWKNNMNFIQPGIPGNTNNWVTYDMWGFNRRQAVGPLGVRQCHHHD